MAASKKVISNINPDFDFKKENQGLHSDSTCESPNPETAAAMDEYYTMKEHPDQYKHYTSFTDAVDDVLSDD